MWWRQDSHGRRPTEAEVHAAAHSRTLDHGGRRARKHGRGRRGRDHHTTRPVDILVVVPSMGDLVELSGTLHVLVTETANGSSLSGYEHFKPQGIRGVDLDDLDPFTEEPVRPRPVSHQPGQRRAHKRLSTTSGHRPRIWGELPCPRRHAPHVQRPRKGGVGEQPRHFLRLAPGPDEFTGSPSRGRTWWQSGGSP